MGTASAQEFNTQEMQKERIRYQQFVLCSCSSFVYKRAFRITTLRRLSRLKIKLKYHFLFYQKSVHSRDPLLLVDVDLNRCVCNEKLCPDTPPSILVAGAGELQVYLSSRELSLSSIFLIRCWPCYCPEAEHVTPLRPTFAVKLADKIRSEGFQTQLGEKNVKC